MSSAPADLDLRSGQVSQPDLFVVHRKPEPLMVDLPACFRRVWAEED